MNPNQVVLITGGGRGLGELSPWLRPKPAPRWPSRRAPKSELAETVELIRQAGGRALALPADVTDHHAIAGVVAATESQLGPIDVLINGAGSFRALGNGGAG